MEMWEENKKYLLTPDTYKFFTIICPYCVCVCSALKPKLSSIEEEVFHFCEWII